MLWEERRERKKNEADSPLISNALLSLPWEQKFLADPPNLNHMGSSNVSGC